MCAYHVPAIVRRSRIAMEEPTLIPIMTAVSDLAGAWVMVMFVGGDGMGDGVASMLELKSEVVERTTVGGIVVVVIVILVLDGDSVVLELSVVGILDVGELSGVVSCAVVSGAVVVLMLTWVEVETVGVNSVVELVDVVVKALSVVTLEAVVVGFAIVCIVMLTDRSSRAIAAGNNWLTLANKRNLKLEQQTARGYTSQL